MILRQFTIEVYLNSNRIKLAFFDSGVGGLSVLSEVIKKVSNCDIVYVADTAKLPYGLLEDSEIISRVNHFADSIFQDCAFDIFVVACNAASTLVLPSLRAKYPSSIVGVIPAIKPAALATKSGIIGLLATPGTIRRVYTQNLIAEFAKNIEVVQVGSSKLVEISENKIRLGVVDHQALRDELRPLSDKSNLDVVVLACTHFPLISQEIQQVLGAQKVLISSGEAVANRVRDILVERKFSKLTGGRPNISFITTSRSGLSDSLLSFIETMGSATVKFSDFGI